MALPRLTRPSAQAQASQRPGIAMAVIMTGVLMTAVDTTIVVLALHGRIADAFTAGLHAAFYASMGFMVLAAGLSALRVRRPHA